jgi:putative FmdB family regulatory protein
MPVYTYTCQDCGETADHVIPFVGRETPQTCLRCGGAAEYEMPAPLTRVAGPRGAIWDDRQVESTHGKNWRDEGTTGRPGGAGRKLHFHR